MLNSLPHSFKFSILSLAVFSAQQSFAENIENLPTISVQATADQTELSSEQSKSGGVSKSMLKKSRLNFDKIEKCK